MSDFDGGGGGFLERGVGPGELDLESGQGFDADPVVGVQDRAFV